MDADSTTTAHIWLDRATALVREGRYDSARVCFGRAAREAAEDDPEAYLTAMNGSVYTLVYAGRIDSARTLLDRTLAREAASPRAPGLALAESYALLAYLHSYFDRIDSALAANARSMSIRRSILGEAHELLSSNYYTNGIANAKKGRFTDALDDLRRALQLCPGDHRSAARQAQIHVALGNTLRESHQYPAAIGHLDSSIVLLHRAGKVMSYDMVSAFLYTGYCHTARGDLESALAYYDSARALAKLVCPDNAIVTTSIRASMGQAYLALGDLDRALEVCSDAIDRNRALRDKAPSGEATIHATLARAYLDKGDTAAALEHAQAALSLRRSAFGATHPDIAAALEGLADIESRVGRDRDALIHLREAVGIRELLAGVTGRALVASPMIALAHAQCERGDIPGADATIAELMRREHAALPGEPLLYARALEGLGDIRMKDGHPSTAVALYDSAMHVLLRTVGDRGGVPYERLADLSGGQQFLRLLVRKGRALQTLPREDSAGTSLAAAVDVYEHACRLILSIRARYESERSKLRGAGDLEDACGEGLSLSLGLYERTKDRQYLARAYAFAEVNKAGMLLDGVRRARVMSFSGVPDELVAEDRSVRSRLTALELEFASQSDAPVADSVRLRQLRWDILGLREASRVCAERLRHTSPAYARLMDYEQFPAVADVQSALDESTVMLEYALGARSAVVFVVTRNSFEVHDLGPRASIERAVAALTTSIRTLEFDRFEKVSRAAYGMLVAPTWRTVARYKRLVVVPDGILSTLPFEALVVGGARPNTGAVHASRLPYLLRSHEIVVSPSARFFCEQHEGGDGPAPAARTFAGFAPVFNDPVVDAPGYASLDAGSDQAQNGFRSVNVHGKNFRALPYSDAEVTGIAGAFRAQGVAARTFIHGEATEENFKRIAPTCTHLHIATHGVLNAHDPARSALLFSPTATPAGEDGILHAAEAYDLPLHADLVVLSSCESGVGKIVNGEGVFALMRGFLYSGARNVMYSLWPVMDRQTSALMQAFYAEAVKGVRPGRALQLAKLKMVAKERTAFPYSWAGFVIVGR